MYWRCHLVHGDLSEYNLLWHDDTVVVIDVSQSVEHDHPRATEFLRKDCQNVNEFFGKTARFPLDTLTTKELYDFVVNDAGPYDDDAIDARPPRGRDAGGRRTGRGGGRPCAASRSRRRGIVRVAAGDGRAPRRRRVAPRAASRSRHGGGVAVAPRGRRGRTRPRRRVRLAAPRPRATDGYRRGPRTTSLLSRRRRCSAL